MRDPIWAVLKHQGRSLKWLARRTGYSYPHVKGVANGQQNVSDEFRRRCAAAMDLPESVLFIAVEQAAS